MALTDPAGTGHVFHTMSTHLSEKIEHHLFSDTPAHRYPEVAPKIRALCWQGVKIKDAPKPIQRLVRAFNSTPTAHFPGLSRDSAPDDF